VIAEADRLVAFSLAALLGPALRTRFLRARLRAWRGFGRFGVGFLRI
jgi:hypothetical protein